MSEVQQAIVLRCYPTPEQAVTLLGWMGCTRFAWNHFVARNKALYEAEKRSDFHARLSALLPGLKKAEETAFLAEPPAISLVDVSRRYDAALRKALKDHKAVKAGRMTRKAAAGFPRFHRKREGMGALTCRGRRMTFTHSVVPQRHRERGTVTIPKLGEVAVRGGRWPTGHVVSARLWMRHDVWTLSVQFNAPAPQDRKPIGEPIAEIVGADLGLSCLVADSLGGKVMPTRPLRAAGARLQRRFGRQETKEKEARERSNNQRRRQQAIARLHRKVEARRAHLLHRASRDLIAKGRVVGLETLGPRR